ncbi:host specificity protein [Xenorhabdus ishibashii]|uniref:Host specificity protein n=1 Tax=Xenorhabdus ishibashii TaxID=1034471 RepID=A0A2D0KHX3_9GAMM|nr:host specificity protein [Xenorhabdus ishibashii]
MINDRFSIGTRVKTENLSLAKWDLYRVAQYCDQLVPDGKGGQEPRHTCNVYIQSQEDGCTRQSEAQRRGKWVLLTNEYDRMVTFTVGLDGKIPLPGYIIGVADEMFSGRVLGGRVSSVNGRNITLDRVSACKINWTIRPKLP